MVKYFLSVVMSHLVFQVSGGEKKTFRVDSGKLNRQRMRVRPGVKYFEKDLLKSTLQAKRTDVIDYIYYTWPEHRYMVTLDMNDRHYLDEGRKKRGAEKNT